MKTFSDSKGQLDFQDENLTIEVTNRCGNSCSHCFVRAKGVADTELDFNTFMLIIDEAFAFGYRHLHITGGEPFLWKHILDAISYAFAKGFTTCFINTNGMLLSTEMCAKLKEFGNRLFFSISLQGPCELHEKMRGNGSYAKTIKGIETALTFNLIINIFTSVGKSLLDCFTIYTKDIYTRFPTISSITFIQLIRVANDLFDHSDELLAPHDFIRLVKNISLLNISGRTAYILENPLACVVAHALHMPWIHPSLPLHRSGRLTILADESITLSHSSEIIIGHYQSLSLQAIITSALYKEYIAPDQETCPSCVHLKRCREHGMIRPSEWYRDMHPEIPYCLRVLDLIADDYT